MVCESRQHAVKTTPMRRASAIKARFNPRRSPFRNGAGLCQGFRASQKSRRRSHSSPSFWAQNSEAYFFFLRSHPHVRAEGHPLHGLTPSVVSLMAATLCLVQNLIPWVPFFTRIQRSPPITCGLPAYSRNLIPARDLVILSSGAVHPAFRSSSGIVLLRPLPVSSAHGGMVCRSSPHNTNNANAPRKCNQGPFRSTPIGHSGRQAWSQFGDPRCINIIAA